MQPTQILQRMIVGSWITQAIYVAAQLGIGDLLKDGSKSNDEWAITTGVDAKSLTPRCTSYVVFVAWFFRAKYIFLHLHFFDFSALKYGRTVGNCY
jgi:hypothetical protein